MISDEIRLSVEFVTVGFLRNCLHSCCDRFPGTRGWCPGVLIRLPLKGALRQLSVEKPVTWNWGECYWGVPQQWWPGNLSSCLSQIIRSDSNVVSSGNRLRLDRSNMLFCFHLIKNQYFFPLLFAFFELERIFFALVFRVQATWNCSWYL